MVISASADEQQMRVSVAEQQMSAPAAEQQMIAPAVERQMSAHAGEWQTSAPAMERQMSAPVARRKLLNCAIITLVNVYVLDADHWELERRSPPRDPSPAIPSRARHVRVPSYEVVSRS